MPETLETLLILCPLVFLAGLVDSIAGGGGLISLPAYLLCGFPAHVAFGSNKLSSSLGTLVATWRYARSRSLDVGIGLAGAGCALLGSFGGTRLALLVSDRGLRIVLVVMLPLVAAFTLLRSRKNNRETAGRDVSRSRSYMLACSFCLVIGAYDGFRPGHGTFLILGVSRSAGLITPKQEAPQTGESAPIWLRSHCLPPHENRFLGRHPRRPLQRSGQLDRFRSGDPRGAV